MVFIKQRKEKIMSVIRRGGQAITGHLEHRQNTNIKVRSYILLPQRHIMWQEEI